MQCAGAVPGPAGEALLCGGRKRTMAWPASHAGLDAPLGPDLS
jgi:hypothetical protein